MITAGFVGTGKMGGALASAVIKAVGGESVMLADYDIEKAKAIAGESGAVCTDSQTVCKECKFIFLGVKPQFLEQTANELKETLAARKDRFILVSMAAGVSTARLAKMFGDYPIIRIMPNTPVAVGEGMIVYCHNSLVSNDEITEFTSALECAGEVSFLEEALIDAATSVSGCGPAFVYMFIKAFADGGVNCGLSPELSLKLAEQTVLGAAKLAIVSGEMPDKLKTDVCSKGGSTIEGVKVLEKEGLEDIVKAAVNASFEKNKKL